MGTVKMQEGKEVRVYQKTPVEPVPGGWEMKWEEGKKMKGKWEGKGQEARGYRPLASCPSPVI